MTRLLVSVRSAQEAESAVRGGASLIDVKEPMRGSLGRASDRVLAEVVRIVAGRRPVSAALGELMEASNAPTELPLAYVKWGLANCQTGWQCKLRDTLHQWEAHQPNCRVVAVAYADWRRAKSPTPEEVCAFAVEYAVGAFLIDTGQKDGSTMLDWLSLLEIESLREQCRVAGVPIAMAGSLGPDEMRRLLPLRPDWFAVRGAVCQGRQRESAIDEDAVRQLTALLSGGR